MMDRDLLNDFARTASEAAFTKLVERYAGLVFGVAMRRTNDRQLAEEVSQNVFLILSRKVRQLREQPEKLPGWLHRTTVLESRNVRRKEARRRDTLTALSDHEEAAKQDKKGGNNNKSGGNKSKGGNAKSNGASGAKKKPATKKSNGSNARKSSGNAPGRNTSGRQGSARSQVQPKARKKKKR